MKVVGGCGGCIHHVDTVLFLVKKKNVHFVGSKKSRVDLTDN